jgi:hypothetical protein
VVGLKLWPDIECDAFGFLDQQVYVYGDQEVRAELSSKVVGRQTVQLRNGVDPHPVSWHARSSSSEPRCP